MRFTHIDVNFDVKYEGHQNCSKTLSMHILGVFGDHHMWRQNWCQNVWTSLCQFIFFVNLLHSLYVWLFDIWHLFDNLTSFWQLDIFLTHEQCGTWVMGYIHLTHLNLNHLIPSQGYFFTFLDISKSWQNSGALDIWNFDPKICMKVPIYLTWFNKNWKNSTLIILQAMAIRVIGHCGAETYVVHGLGGRNWYEWSIQSLSKGM